MRYLISRLHKSIQNYGSKYILQFLHLHNLFYKNMLENLEVSHFSCTFAMNLSPKDGKWAVRGQESPYFVKCTE